MHISVFVWLFLAVAVFWAVGAYNRLVRLRARTREVLGVVEHCLRQQVELLYRRLGVPAGADAEAGAEATWDMARGWIDLTQAVVRLEAVLRRVRGQPPEPQLLLDLASAADSAQNLWRQISEAPADLAGATVPDDMRLEWDALAEKAKSARGALNQALAQYDAAIHQFPAHLLASFLGLRPGGRL